jgi:hypothetical protein
MPQLHTLVYKHPIGKQPFRAPDFNVVTCMVTSNLCTLHLVGINMQDGPIWPEFDRSKIVDLELGHVDPVWKEMSDFTNLRTCKLSFEEDEPDFPLADVSLPHLEELTLIGIPNLDLCALVAHLNAPVLQVLTLVISDPTRAGLLEHGFDFGALEERSTSFSYLHTVNITCPWLCSNIEQLSKVAPNLLRLSLVVTIGGLWDTLKTWAEVEKEEWKVRSPRLSHIHLSSECREGNMPGLITFLRHRLDTIGPGRFKDVAAGFQMEVKLEDFEGVSTAAWCDLWCHEGSWGHFRLKVLDCSCSVRVQSISWSA